MPKGQKILAIFQRNPWFLELQLTPFLALSLSFSLSLILSVCDTILHAWMNKQTYQPSPMGSGQYLWIDRFDYIFIFFAFSFICTLATQPFLFKQRCLTVSIIHILATTTTFPYFALNSFGLDLIFYHRFDKI